MKMHPWLEKYPIHPESKYLIIGTHPPMPYCGKLEFYYGNMSEFWKILDLVYPGNMLYPNGCPKSQDIKGFLAKNKISITDIVYKTNVDKFSIDKAMGKVNKEDLNPFLLGWLINSNIHTIYFTSFGGSNSAKNLFRKWYRDTYNKACKLTNEHVNEIEIEGRIVKIIDLFSPSPSGRRGLPKSKKFIEWSKMNTNKKDYDGFRLYWYKKHLPKINL
jgi:G:T/U-mismatch repair DNA glycosylase